MKPRSSLPVGVFDSGLGGLTVVRELRRRLPSENIIYIGDTARVPYGTKSPDTIRRYALQIAFVLLQKKVKAIVVACNSVSAVALKHLSRIPLPVIGVIEPGARSAALKSKSRRIGVIGTPATVASHAYKHAIHRHAPRAKVSEVPCALFVPLVEAGWLSHEVTTRVAKEYLKPLAKARVDTLVLGCTHYPLLKNTLRSVMGNSVHLIDSAEATANDVEALLKKKGQLNTSKKRGTLSCYVTDNPESFTNVGGRFFRQSRRPRETLEFG